MVPVPKVFTMTETGSATPIAYANCTSVRVASPDGHNVLGDIPSHVAGRTIDLRRILARKRAAAVPAHAAVAVHDDLAAREAGIAVRSADHEAPGRVDVVLGVPVHHVLRHHRVDDELADICAQLLGGNMVAVLGRDHDGIDAHGLPFTYSTETWLLPSGRRYSSLPDLRTSESCFVSLMRQLDRQGHQFVGFVAGITEHQALIARAARIHAHRDIGRLALNGVQNAAGLGVETKQPRRCSRFP